ncbi:MAG: isoprenyl transferase [Syntrophobacteraceae bacterium]|nr:isoprenyl transferase [Syntrophobacteraceae bacterium]
MDRLDLNKLPRHVAIIMDGNGRWAKQKLLNRITGHREGLKSVREVVRCCRKLEIPYLTLYAFSKENWQRPPHEVEALWVLLKRFLKSELPELMENEIRLHHLGDPQGIPQDVLADLRRVEGKTASFDRLTLSLAINYGGRQEIAQAAWAYAMDVLKGNVSPEPLNPSGFAAYLYTSEIPDPDLIIRTGGEYRISNFLLWQAAYAELYITGTLWPDFRESEFFDALVDFQGRERRFGRTGEQIREEVG